MKERILVVDDEKEIADLLQVYLQNDGYEVITFYCGKDALDYMKASPPDMAILDVMLPDVDGFTMLQTLRKDHFFPVIMLTAKVTDMDKITGLTLGADDYITKPFNPLEVVARVKTQLRRYISYNRNNDGVLPEQSYDIRGLVINKDTHSCRLYDQEINLTPLEFSILWYLCERMGKVVSSEELFEVVWGERYLENCNNTIMAHIGRLREKLQEPAKRPKFIKTVWGVGYKIEE
ncbi:two-component system response regulator VanR [Clostridiales Family XIII bacterium PM5-7]